MGRPVTISDLSLYLIVTISDYHFMRLNSILDVFLKLNVLFQVVSAGFEQGRVFDLAQVSSADLSSQVRGQEPVGNSSVSVRFVWTK